VHTIEDVKSDKAVGLDARVRPSLARCSDEGREVYTIFAVR